MRLSRVVANIRSLRLGTRLPFRRPLSVKRLVNTDSLRSKAVSSANMAAPPRIVIVPGNGGSGSLDDLRESNFYGWAEEQFRALGLDVRMQPMPDPLRARENIWVPFITGTLEANEDAVLIGHSSGAAAALRVAEKRKLRGMVLVAGYDSDLGDELEAASGYFSRPFDWAAMQANCGFIVQFAGARDRLVPIAVQRRVAEHLAPKCQYIEQPQGDHFFEPPFQELIETVMGAIEKK